MRRLCTLAMLLLSSHLSALYTDDVYVAFGGGAVFPSTNSSTKSNSSSVLFTPTAVTTSFFTLPNVVWKNKYNQVGYELYGALGYRFCSEIRIESEFVYQNFRRKLSGHYNWQEVNAITTAIFDATIDNPIRHASTHANLYCLFSNAFYDFRKCCCPLSFSVGGGIGVAWLKSNTTTKHNVLVINTIIPPVIESAPTMEKSPKLYGVAFAWHVKLGLNYDIVENFRVSLNYRLLGTTKFRSGDSTITTNPGALGQAIFKIPRNDVRGFLNNSLSISFTYSL